LAANAISWKPRLRSSDALLGGNGGHGGGGVRFDLLGMLINIYGSKELFVDEYRAVLSGKLLRNTSFDTSKEVSTLELLKLRFGEAAMHHCEIMVRDVDESKRLNNTVSSKLKADHSAIIRIISAGGAVTAAAAAAVKEEGEQTKQTQQAQGKEQGEAQAERRRKHAAAVAAAASGAVDATVVSEHYWPELLTAGDEGTSSSGGGRDCDGRGGGGSTFVLHPVAKELLGQYNECFKVLKKPRELLWRQELGNVDLDIEFKPKNKNQNEGEDKEAEAVVLSFSVSPVLATLILHFDDDDDDGGAGASGDGGDGDGGGSGSGGGCRRTAAQLATLTGLPQAQVRRRMDFWVHAGVVSAETCHAAHDSSHDGDDAYSERTARQAGRDSGVGSDVLYTTLDEPFGGKAHAGGAGVGDSEGERKHEDGGGGGGRASNKMHHEHA